MGIKSISRSYNCHAWMGLSRCKTIIITWRQRMWIRVEDGFAVHEVAQSYDVNLCTFHNWRSQKLSKICSRHDYEEFMMLCIYFFMISITTATFLSKYYIYLYTYSVFPITYTVETNPETQKIEPTYFLPLWRVQLYNINFWVVSCSDRRRQREWWKFYVC